MQVPSFTACCRGRRTPAAFDDLDQRPRIGLTRVVVDVGGLSGWIDVDANYAVGRGQLTLDCPGPRPTAAEVVHRDPEPTLDVHAGQRRHSA